ncbi:MAG: glycosyltransferase [Paludibacteraceae bacterium]|nr:glycosyltransferase [Paludibacteraceae bacterium]
MKVSVAMAVYNGEKYINDQVKSILVQLKTDDELIVSIDKCTDKTEEFLRAIQQQDNRIKIFNNPYRPGVVKNFQNAVEHCTGDIIFYSDQDDVWMSNKIEEVEKVFKNPRVAAVIHDAQLTDSNLNIISTSTFKLRGGARTSFWGNFVRLSYIGCCMAFRSIYKEVLTPIPTIYRSHDWWTGSMLACGKTKIIAIDKPLILHRLHDGNVTPKIRPSLRYQLSTRWIIFKNVIFRYKKKIQLDKFLGL